MLELEELRDGYLNRKSTKKSKRDGDFDKMLFNKSAKNKKASLNDRLKSPLGQIAQKSPRDKFKH